MHYPRTYNSLLRQDIFQRSVVYFFATILMFPTRWLYQPALIFFFFSVPQQMRDEQSLKFLHYYKYKDQRLLCPLHSILFYQNKYRLSVRDRSQNQHHSNSSLSKEKDVKAICKSLQGGCWQIIATPFLVLIILAQALLL